METPRAATMNELAKLAGACIAAAADIRGIMAENAIGGRETPLGEDAVAEPHTQRAKRR